MTKFICETKNLSKKYKDFYALKNVNLTIPKGEIYGLVGENGAGKNDFNQVINRSLILRAREKLSYLDIRIICNMKGQKSVARLKCLRYIRI